MPKDKHKHDAKKEGRLEWVTLGEEKVAYRHMHCSVCGKYMENKIVARRKMGPK